ncbi:hypothetical protein [Halogeometricum limi]|uniref:Uncharacterized protein n=1 Tax=Halogeometricum limi TaxID=555875 RepID=A0A1I6G1W2_9EURY|nr:hypothetical protein [Halogeometricum limi]SFR36131.1 hypothetical protein SAMN04488124_0728 [Halogeometricum limi]
MAVELLVFALFALLSVGGTLLLYAFIQRETDAEETMDRRDAEREAQEESRRR